MQQIGISPTHISHADERKSRIGGHTLEESDCCLTKKSNSYIVSGRNKVYQVLKWVKQYKSFAVKYVLCIIELDALRHNIIKIYIHSHLFFNIVVIQCIKYSW